MKKGEKRKSELLQIAYRLFVSKGYENTSVDEIIEEAKIAKGTYYYYFESKEQMLEEVTELMIEREAAVAEEIAASDLPAPEKFIGIISSFRIFIKLPAFTKSIPFSFLISVGSLISSSFTACRKMPESFLCQSIS